MIFIKNYIEYIVNYDLLNKFKYNSIVNIPQLKKIYLNFKCKTSLLKYLLSSLIALELISSKKSVLTYAKKANIQFKLKKGSPVGCTVILRKKLMYLFLSELLVTIFPKIFKSTNFYLKKIKVFSFKIRNPLIFDELEKRYSYFNKLTSLNITIVSNSKNKKEFIFLLNSFKIPVF